MKTVNEEKQKEGNRYFCYDSSNDGRNQQVLPVTASEAEQIKTDPLYSDFDDPVKKWARDTLYQNFASHETHSDFLSSFYELPQETGDRMQVMSNVLSFMGVSSIAQQGFPIPERFKKILEADPDKRETLQWANLDKREALQWAQVAIYTLGVRKGLIPIHTFGPTKDNRRMLAILNAPVDFSEEANAIELEKTLKQFIWGAISWFTSSESEEADL